MFVGGDEKRGSTHIYVTSQISALSLWPYTYEIDRLLKMPETHRNRCGLPPQIFLKILKSFEVKKTLNPHIWTKDKDGDSVLRPEVRDKLLIISNDFLTFVDIDNLDCNTITKECTIEDVTITGSICNYNWSKFSDIDLHLLVDFGKIDENEKLVNNIPSSI